MSNPGEHRSVRKSPGVDLITDFRTDGCRELRFGGLAGTPASMKHAAGRPKKVEGVNLINYLLTNGCSKFNMCEVMGALNGRPRGHPASDDRPLRSYSFVTPSPRFFSFLFLCHFAVSGQGFRRVLILFELSVQATAEKVT